MKPWALVTVNSILLACGVVCHTPDDATASNGTLQLLHVVFRHGPRTPVDTYANDPYINEELFPYGWGHLTNSAKKELFELGKWIRRRYRNSLPSFYQPDFLHAQSTASPRTHMSMGLVLAGLFPPKHTPMEWNEKLNWQPIPIYSQPYETDYLLRMNSKCPRYKVALKEVFQLPEIRTELKLHEELFEELTTITGMNISSALDVNSLFWTLMAEQAYGLQLPAWTRAYFPERLKFMAVRNYLYLAYTSEMRRIKGGPFLKKMFEEMQLKTAGQLQPSERKLFLYCAHDWTLANILLALGIWNQETLHFYALLAIELHKSAATGEHFVKIYLKNGPLASLEKLIVPGCDFHCPLEKLLELRSEILPDRSYDEMCQVDGESP